MKVNFSNLRESLKKSILSNYSYLDENKELNRLIHGAILIEARQNYRYGFKNVYKSKELFINPLYKKFRNQINDIENAFSNNEFKTIEKRISDKHIKNKLNVDEMLSVLDIEHFHLSENVNEKTRELLFVKYKNNNVYFIDIFTHKNFFDK